MRTLVTTVKSSLAPVMALIVFGASARPFAPAGLLVNGANQPLAIDRDSLRFTWMSPDSSRGETQTAYQILVASKPDQLNAKKADYWDSGEVASDNSVSVEYAGKALPAATRFWWKVRTWDQTGKASEYSTSSFFDTGLNHGEWTAQYIWDGTTNLNNFAYFRKTFSVAQTPNLAKVYVTAHNDYLLYLNGQLLGRGPARCDPYH
jgi:alpha-L-rhamnosidase